MKQGKKFDARLLKDRSWMDRNPRAFVLIGLTISLGLLFSHPIYVMLTYPKKREISQ